MTNVFVSSSSHLHSLLCYGNSPMTSSSICVRFYIQNAKCRVSKVGSKWIYMNYMIIQMFNLDAIVVLHMFKG